MTIIIPAYNADKTICGCIKSITDQQQKNVEVIVVNDGSTDTTNTILEGIVLQHEYITHITVNNGGPASARNTGLANANGDYVYFIDSDDKVNKKLFTTIFEVINNQKPDVFIFGYNIVDPQGKIISKYTYQNTEVKGKEELNSHLANLYEANLLNQVWNKVFKLSLIKNNDIQFKNYRYGEDRLFVFESLARAKDIIISDKRLYNYETGYRESLITKYYDKKLEIVLQIHEQLLSLAHSCGPISKQSKEIYNYMFIKGLISCITNLYSKSCNLYYFQKKDYIKNLTSNKEFQKAVKTHFVRPAYFIFLVKILKTKNVYLILFTARLINLASWLSPKLFIRAKHEKH